MQYRKDIDGLRAVAIMAVLLFHYFPHRIPGGFLGVDIFFVISGYLISKITLTEVACGNFQLTIFYYKRIRRIFPALILVLIFCLVLGYLALFPSEYLSLGKYIAAGASFTTNIILWEELGYFDINAQYKPLLNLWSLSVEEQFYIIWPLILLFYKTKKLETITVIILIFSFIAYILVLNSDPAAAFYIPITRFWEILCGVVLANLELLNSNKLNRPMLRDFVSTAGLLLISLSLFGIKNEGLTGGWVGNVLVIVGTAILILSGPLALINKWFLQIKPLCFIGLISYPLYLWHWPLLVYLKIIEGVELSRYIKIGCILLSLGLAVLTYIFIEKPLRNIKYSKKALYLYLLLMILIGFSGLYVFYNKGLPLRSYTFGLAQNLHLEKPITSRISDGSCKTLTDLKFNKDNVCLVKTTQPNLAIIGDSHAMALNSAIFMRDKNYQNSILMAGHGCGLFLGYKNVTVDGSFQRKGCDSLAEEIIDSIDKLKSIKEVVILFRGYGLEDESSESYGYKLIPSAGYQALNAQEMYINGFKNFLMRISKLDRSITVVIDYPWMQSDPEQCLTRPFTILGIKNEFCRRPKSNVDSFQRLHRESINLIKESMQNIKVYDPINLFCDQIYCYGIGNEKLLYWDRDHLTLYSSGLVVDDLFSRVLSK
ncbi:acyltransferase family protein [Polynucleobacter sp. UB-Siik-W21]|uniref:acyltransferase family protein n=1 Tax=Polynucleobacter sp. UB-Siik-W21 TaxID=1855646 RepID=UPI001BFD40ED|nr:acyltransferase family protein [Polynucleobacter sp. UB-Siik-W21]QWD70703.1 acyltransferase [Polynucleobacter sp. UB-Siik-W21]